MPEMPFLQELLLVIAVALLTVFATRRLHAPTVVGFLIAGVIAGPGCLALVHDRHHIDLLAEIGIVFLMFTIGLKISLKDLHRMKGLVVGAGGLQVVGTAALVAGVAAAAGMPVNRSVFLGLLVAMSSTAIVLKQLEDRGEGGASHGRIALGILIFQDLAIVPIMLLVPLLGTTGDASAATALTALVTSAAMLVGIIVAALFVLPWLLERVVRVRSREVFTLTVLLAVLGTAYLTSQAGLSLALGAFLAGIVISESEYSHQILSEVAPFRDAMSSLFFVSVGMLVTPKMWIESPVTTLLAAAGVFLVKAGIVFLVSLCVGFGKRAAVLAAVALAQIGEFSFIIAKAGEGVGLIPKDLYATFLSVSVLTMALTPVLMRFAPFLANRAPDVRWVTRYLSRGKPKDDVYTDAEPTMTNHVIIIGYGVNGQSVARVLRQMEIPYLFLELNPITVRRVRETGETIHYGDAASADVLYRIGVKRAKALVITVPDPTSARQAVAHARRANPELFIIVRTRFVTEVTELLALGANEAVPEEFATSLELVGAVMKTFGVSERLIARERTMIREGGFSLLRAADAEPTVTTHPTLQALAATADVSELTLAEESPAIGQTLRALDLRHRTGTSILAVERHGALIGNPDPTFVLQLDDVVLLFGKALEIEAAETYLSPPTREDDATTSESAPPSAE